MTKNTSVLPTWVSLTITSEWSTRPRATTMKHSLGWAKPNPCSKKPRTGRIWLRCTTTSGVSTTPAGRTTGRWATSSGPRRCWRRSATGPVLATVLNNIGAIYHARGAYDRALGYFERAAPVLEEIGDRAVLATVQSNLAALCLRAGDDVAAEAYLRSSSALFDELGLDTDNAQATRKMLMLGLTKGWEAAREGLAPDEESSTSPVQAEVSPFRSPTDALRRLIMEELGEESGADSMPNRPSERDSDAPHPGAAEIGSEEEL